MKILVTGAAGFIGSHLCEALLAAGHAVVAVDNLSTGRREWVPQEAEFWRASILDTELLDGILKETRPGAIVHLAAQSSLFESTRRPVATVMDNVVGTQIVLEAAREHDVLQVVFASTGAVYNHQNDDTRPLTETDLCYPNSVYGASKLAGEHFVRAWSAANHRIATVLRFGNVYGPRQTPIGENQLIPRAIAGFRGRAPFAIYGDGRHVRDYVFVADVVDAIRRVVDNSVAGTYNVGTGKGHTTNEVVAGIALALDHEMGNVPRADYPGPEGKAIVLAVSRAWRAFGWLARTTLHEGIAQTIAVARADDRIAARVWETD